MEKKVIEVCIIVGILGIISAISGFAAEYYRAKESEEWAGGWECEYPSSPTTGLGIVGALTLASARIILSLAGGCCTCFRQNNPKYSFAARLCSILSWLASVVAMFLLLSGAVIVNGQRLELRNNGRFTCYIVKGGVYTGGAIMALASVVLGAIFFITLSSAKHDSPGGTLDDDIEKGANVALKPPPTAPLEILSTKKC